MTFDLIAVQRMNGAVLETLRRDIPVAEALGALRASQREDLGAGTTTTMLIATTDPLHQVRQELQRAQRQHAPLNSAHEAYAVILEELDEFKAEVWGTRADARDPARLRAELIQIAAMAIRAIEDLGL
jgi:hypothetical protein